MKLLVATAISGALIAGLFFLPIGGRTLWQRAESRGYPQSAARAMSNGAHAAVRWAERKEPRPNPPENMPGHKAPPRRDAVAKVAPAHAPIVGVPTKSIPAAPGAARSDPAPAQPEPVRALHAAPAQPAPAHDHILAAPPEEKLSSQDRRGLDKLIAHAQR